MSLNTFAVWFIATTLRLNCELLPAIFLSLSKSPFDVLYPSAEPFRAGLLLFSSHGFREVRQHPACQQLAYFRRAPEKPHDVPHERRHREREPQPQGRLALAPAHVRDGVAGPRAVREERQVKSAAPPPDMSTAKA